MTALDVSNRVAAAAIGVGPLAVWVIVVWWRGIRSTYPKPTATDRLFAAELHDGMDGIERP